MTDLVSIVLITYNRYSKLKECIRSIRDQEYENWELIIINDCSIDQTEQYLESISSNNINIYHNSINKGLVVNLNIAISKAKGTLIARIDDDDKWVHRDKLSLQVNEFKSNQDLGLLGSSYKIDENEFQNPFSDKKIRMQMLFRCPFRHSTVMFRKSSWLEAGKYNELIRYGEDWDLWLRIGKTYELKNLETITAQITEGENMSENNFKSQLNLPFELLKENRENYPLFRIAFIFHTFSKLVLTTLRKNSKIHILLKKIYRIIFLKG
tara:strand:+ start:13348 stop:14148 length:801 start_codon:yes stop_codon:yes gene_type:complete